MFRSRVIALFVCFLFVLSVVGCNNGGVKDDISSESAGESLSNSVSVDITETSTEANAEAEKEKPYYYALINSDHMTKEDMGAIDSIISSYSDHDTVLIDVKECESAAEVFCLIREDRDGRDRDPDGIQIFGNSDAVPSFEVFYKIAFENEYSTEENFLTDYFYSNLDNDPSVLEGFSVADNFENGLGVNFAPKWQVVRLPIAGGKFSNFVENYREYMESEQYGKPLAVSMSNSIFPYDAAIEGNCAIEDFAYLLHRAEHEWKFLQGAKLYGNTRGYCPSLYAIHGDSSLEAMKTENKAGICEFFYVGHGSEVQLTRTVFTVNEEKRKLDQDVEEFLYVTDLNRVLKSNPYYFNLWSCNTAANMRANLVVEAFDGKCIGAFAGTTLLANNGSDFKAEMVEDGRSTNMLYFHYEYFAAVKSGLGRSQAFFEAQRSFADIATEYAKQPIDYSNNYQCGFLNLIAYHNFGIIDPDGEMPEVTPSDKGIDEPLSFKLVGRDAGGAEIGERVTLTESVYHQSGKLAARIKKVECVLLDNGNLRIFAELDSKISSRVRALLMQTQMDLGATYIPTHSNVLYVTDVPLEKLKNEEHLYLIFESNADTSVIWSLYGFHRLIED
jgi:hypothetical protein